MYGSPQKRGGASSQHRVLPLKGLFSDGIWQCKSIEHFKILADKLSGNCDPRLPAPRFQVKKEGPNKGKWFYTCQLPKDEGCGFFLWDEKAVGREMGAIINNKRSEPEHLLRTPADASRDQRTIEGHNAASNKWIQDLGKAKEDEFGDWPLSEEEDKKVVQVAPRALPGAYPETPRKATETIQLLTPASKRKREEGYLPTPATTNREDDVFGSLSVNRLKGGMWDGNEPFGVGSPATTPTPGRYRDASVAGDSQSSVVNDYDITEEVIDMLRYQHIDEETMSSLQTLLNKHALKISGIAKGRDITRLALKAKDSKIAQLQQKVNSLEAERELDKILIKQLKNQ